MTMARFDLFVNPNKAARHLLYLDVQRDFVTLSTQLCIPLSDMIRSSQSCKERKHCLRLINVNSSWTRPICLRFL